MKYSHVRPFSYGLNQMVIAESHPEIMGLNFDLLKLEAATTYSLSMQKEKLIVLLNGTVEYVWENEKKTVHRGDCFHDSPNPLHLDEKMGVEITNIGEIDCELIIVSTQNPRHFNSMFYETKDLSSVEIVGETALQGKTKRVKRVFFDRTSRPETNIFCGELVNFPGCWACFPPHIHVEPEIYFYRFLPEMGYGFSEQGDDVYKVRNNELVGISKHKTHSQVTAPGYAGFIFWAQKLQDNEKDIEYNLVTEHAWVENPDAAFYPELKASKAFPTKV